MSRDTDMGFLGVADQEHNPSRFCHEVASCNYEPADRAQALLRGKHLFFGQQLTHFVQKVVCTVYHSR